MASEALMAKKGRGAMDRKCFTLASNCSDKLLAFPNKDEGSCFPSEAVDMNGRFQMQGGKNWFLPKEMNANRFFWDSHWLEIWSNHFYPSMGPNGGSVAMDSEFESRGLSCYKIISLAAPSVVQARLAY